jgi:hypothetical protein
MFCAKTEETHMIISASRRTDIPAFFSDWFFYRIKEKYVYVRNPINIHQVSRINLAPDVVDCIVFWSKNPQPMLEKLDCLNDYMYYFQFTLNAYNADIEQNLPALSERIQTFKKLSDCLGRQRVIWRYDPILLTRQYTPKWHMETYAFLAEELSPYTEQCIFSFVTPYSSLLKIMQTQRIHIPAPEDKLALAKALSDIARSHGLTLHTCAEGMDLSPFSIGHARCIDASLIGRLLGCAMDTPKDKGQRPACGCAASIDLGLYNTCQNGCVYCYANHHPDTRRQTIQAYDKYAPFLCSNLTEKDSITVRNVKSEKDWQLRLFDTT